MEETNKTQEQPAPESNPQTIDSNQDQWNYYNMVNAVEPEKKKHSGTNQTPAKKYQRKKNKARRVQKHSRKMNRK